MRERDDSHTGLGSIKIHRNVIASVSALAALEVEGVKRIGTSFITKLFEIFGKKSYSAIIVDIDKSGDIRVKLPLIIKYGFNVPDVASKVQDNVHAVLEKMTNLGIKDININVRGIERG